MLYKVISETDKKDVVIVAVKPQVVDAQGAFISLGNAASSLSPLLDIKAGLQNINGEYWQIINNDWWKTEDGTKRKIMAECLIPNGIPPIDIHSVYVTSPAVAERVRPVLNEFPHPMSVVVEPHMFFQPRRRGAITDKLSWVDGDMFFSQMQTLTVSVNTVGVMGKGLASRAKYQFPDMYVVYQDVCKSKALVMGKPYLYKREASLDEDLADEPLSMPNLNANKWFLLFPTKVSFFAPNVTTSFHPNLTTHMRPKFTTQRIGKLLKFRYPHGKNAGEDHAEQEQKTYGRTRNSDPVARRSQQPENQPGYGHCPADRATLPSMG